MPEAPEEKNPERIPERKNPPFQSLSFTLAEEPRGRSVVRMARRDDGMYSLHVEQGSGGNPKVRFTRMVPQGTAQQLKDALQNAGVFDWKPEYGNVAGRPAMRWTFNLVFKEGVFSMASAGGNDAPPSFGVLMEQLYRLDLPRPEEGVANAAQAGGAWLPGMDFSKLEGLLPEGGLEGFSLEEFQRMFAEASANPAEFSERLRSEFRSLPPDEREELLDALAAMGMASRAWWENFLGGAGL